MSIGYWALTIALPLCGLWALAVRRVLHKVPARGAHARPWHGPEHTGSMLPDVDPQEAPGGVTDDEWFASLHDPQAEAPTVFLGLGLEGMREATVARETRTLPHAVWPGEWEETAMVDFTPAGTRVEIVELDPLPPVMDSLPLMRECRAFMRAQDLECQRFMDDMRNNPLYIYDREAA